MSRSNKNENKHISLLVLPKYGVLAASSRQRMYKFKPIFEHQNISSKFYPLFDNNYLSKYFSGRKRNIITIIKYYIYRLWCLRNVKQYDVVLIHIEILPYFWSLPERILKWLDIPYILDFDDAIFHQYENSKYWTVRRLLSRKISNSMKRANVVISGNNYIAEYARSAGAKNIHIIPTSVDCTSYVVKDHKAQHNNKFTIGWIGSRSTAKYLHTIAKALEEFCADGMSVVRLVGSGEINLNNTPLDIIEWSEESEVQLINSFDVGIMPLPDEQWARGKCGFKLIQYMACGIPVIASPVGMNIELVKNNINGFLADTHNDWINSLTHLRDNIDMRYKMGQEGRKLVEEKYCLDIAGNKLVELIKSCVNKV